MNFLDCFDCTSPEELILMSTAFSIAISKDLSSDQLSSLGNFIQAVGQNVETIGAQRQLNENNCKK